MGLTSSFRAQFELELGIKPYFSNAPFGNSPTLGLNPLPTPRAHGPRRENTKLPIGILDAY